MSTKAWREKNIDKMREYRRTYYLNNKESEKTRIKKRTKETRVWFKKYKSTLQCNRCPENHPACLDFHHKNKKKKEINISLVASQGWSRERIFKEIKKCEVLCSNCHRKEHYRD